MEVGLYNYELLHSMSLQRLSQILLGSRLPQTIASFTKENLHFYEN